MCLDKLTEGANPAEEGEGWKVFRYNLLGKTLASPFFFVNRDTEEAFNQKYVVNTWITDDNDYLISDNDYLISDNDYLISDNDYLISDNDDLYDLRGRPSYRTGFHIFEKKEDAETYANLGRNLIVRKVKFRNVAAKGTEYIATNVSAPTIVAREIFIEKEETECA